MLHGLKRVPRTMELLSFMVHVRVQAYICVRAHTLLLRPCCTPVHTHIQMPTFGVYLANPILSLVDTAVVGQFCDATELASLGPGCSLCDMTVFMFNFLALATTTLLARSLSQNDLVAFRHAPVHMHPS